MKEEDYLKERVENQINWYEGKSSSNKSAFMRLKVLEIILALLVPFLTGYITGGNAFNLKIAVGVIGLVVAAIAGITTLFKLQENWIAYRSVAESLKYEKYLFLTKSGPYRDPGGFFLFVERVEGIIAKENAKWATNYDSTKQEADGGNTNASAGKPAFSGNGNGSVPATPDQ